MARTRASERIGLENALTLRCRCNKRLGFLGTGVWGAFENVYLVPSREGQPVFGDDWSRIDCPKCGASFEYRRPAYEEAWRRARNAGANTVVLPLLDDVSRGETSSRDW